MTAAIYARKSTDQSAVADEAKSVRRQIDTRGPMRRARAGRSTRRTSTSTTESAGPNSPGALVSCG